ncbi:hypothetical protein MKW92_029804 [Papaver armeniacum]|nr:hypothetical protein MKW92_029804 [Papaver armeniacum]
MAVNICFCAIAFFISLLVMLDIVFHFKKRAGYKLPPSPLALPIIGHMHLIGSVPYRSFHKLSIQYGPLIYLRLGSIPCMVVSSPELTKDFLTTNELNFASRPVTIAVNYLNYNSSGFAFAPSGTLWSFMKKVLMSEFLGGQALMKHRHILRNEIHSSVQLLIKKSATGDRVNGGYKDFWSVQSLGCFWLLRNMDLQGYLKKSTEVRRRYDIILERIMHEREEARTRKEQTVDVGTSGNKVKDLLDILLDVSEDTNSEIKLSRDNIKAFLLDIMTAGIDTTASSVEWALGELINHPCMLEKARGEIDSVVGKNVRLVDESDLPNLPYIQAIFKEVLRLHPPVPMLLRESSRDCTVAGYDIPAKTWLFVNVWSINRNPSYWKDPLEFRPERFMMSLTQNSALHEGVNDKCDQYRPSRMNRDVRGQHFDLLPFGTGRRGCPGTGLSLLEGPTVLAAIIQCLDWKVVGINGSNVVDMTERPGVIVPMANPIILAISTRFNPF